MRKVLPVLLLVASCVGCEKGLLEPETICEEALRRARNEMNEDKKLSILEDAIDQLGDYSYAFDLREEADDIWAQRERRFCTKSEAGREEYFALVKRLHALGAKDDPTELASEVRAFIRAHKGTDLAFDLRRCYRTKLLEHLKDTDRPPIDWGLELPQALSLGDEEKLGRRKEAGLLAKAALEAIGASPADHSNNVRKLNRALARVRELDPASPFVKALEEAMAEEKKAIDKQRTRGAEKAMTEAVNRAEGKGPRALVEELEAIGKQVAGTQVEERLWRPFLEKARKELAEEDERERREKKAGAAARKAVARAKNCGLDYEKARDILRSALEEVGGTKAERGLRRKLAAAERKTPERLNAKAVRLLGKRDIDGAAAVLREIVEQEEFTKRVDYSGSLAFQIGATLAREFSAYSPKDAQARGFTSTHDEAVHYYVLAASRNSETDRGLLEAAALLLEMKLPGRARRCLEEARGSSQLNVRNEAERRLRELDARPEG